MSPMIRWMTSPKMSLLKLRLKMRETKSARTSVRTELMNLRRHERNGMINSEESQEVGDE